MSVEGFWFEPDSSTRHDATMNVAADNFWLTVSGQSVRNGSLSELSVSDRVGNMPRKLTWPDGAMFETRDNDIVDSWLSSSKHKASRSIAIHRIESSWKWVVVALLVTVLVGYLGIRYGLPAASESIAQQLPASVNDTVSEQALSALDRLLFDDAEVSSERQAEVQRQFDELLSALPATDIEFKLHFRSMGGVPNAMALPGGDVIVTDAFLELVEHPQELEAVLLHEIGHVVEHHGMTQVIRASAMSVIVALAFGDLSAMGEVAVGIPVFVMQNSYSQVAETEADAYAFARMRELDKDPKYFADIILRLGEEALDESREDSGRNYFASHPDTQARARKALEASRAMQDEVR